jgi:hypothetical protein
MSSVLNVAAIEDDDPVATFILPKTNNPSFNTDCDAS